MLKNIVIVSDYLRINGGAAKVAVMSALGLAKHPLNVYFFCAEEQNNGHYDFTTVCTNQHDIVNDPNRMRVAFQALWNKKAFAVTKNLLGEFSPKDTIVHVHSWVNALSSSPLKLVRNLGFPLILTCHDYFVACPYGGFFDHSVGKICPKEPLSLGCLTRVCGSHGSFVRKQWFSLKQLVQKNIGKVPDCFSAFITISDFSEKILSPYLPPEIPRYRVPNPIDCEQRERPVDVAGNDAFLFVGRISKEKGVRLFAEAVTLAGVRGVVAGDGPEREKLQREFPNLEWLGWQSPEQVKMAMSRARALAFPSLLYETLGLTVSEASALGVPSIVSDVCAARDSINDEISGLLFKNGDVADLARQIKRLSDSPELARRLGESAFADFWRDPPTTEKHIERLLEVYERVLEE